MLFTVEIFEFLIACFFSLSRSSSTKREREKTLLTGLRGWIEPSLRGEILGVTSKRLWDWALFLFYFIYRYLLLLCLCLCLLAWVCDADGNSSFSNYKYPYPLLHYSIFSSRYLHNVQSFPEYLLDVLI